MESGTVLASRYRLDKLLGRGGMGEVWQGWGFYRESGRWVSWFAASELPGRVTALAGSMSRPGGHWAVADGVPYLKLGNQEPHELCGPSQASPVCLPVLDVAVSFGAGTPEVFALDSAGTVWQLRWPDKRWMLWDDTLIRYRDPVSAIAVASNDASRQAFAAMAVPGSS